MPKAFVMITTIPDPDRLGVVPAVADPDASTNAAGNEGAPIVEEITFSASTASTIQVPTTGRLRRVWDVYVDTDAWVTRGASPSAAAPVAGNSGPIFQAAKTTRLYEALPGQRIAIMAATGYV